MTNIIGQRIRQERERHDMSQNALAELVGLSNKSQVARIETGERKVDSMLLRAFADVFDVPMDSFFDEGRLQVLTYARTGQGQSAELDRMTTWGLNLLADVRFAKQEAASRGW